MLVRLGLAHRDPLGPLYEPSCAQDKWTPQHTYIGWANNEGTVSTQCKVNNGDYECLKEGYISFD